jgi:hypothetical protein
VNRVLRVCLASALAIGLLALLDGCVAGGVGYEEGGGVSYQADFYEPYGYEYGGWGPGYRVGPWLGGDHRPDGRPGNSRPPAYRPAAPSRSMPSIPSRSRGR